MDGRLTKLFNTSLEREISMSWFTDIFSGKKSDPNTSVPVVTSAPKSVSPAVPPAGNSTSTPTGVKPSMESACPAPGVFGAVDLSQPVTQHFLDVMKYLGVRIIVRYYEQAHETIKGKTPTAPELALIAKNGFKMLGVFQHSNNSVATFQDTSRGKGDAARSLELAKQWKQPAGSCIYFGVDFDASTADLVYVKRYAKDFGDSVRSAGFRVGAYGSGLTLETLIAAGLIDMAWLSMATGHRDSMAFAAEGKWALHQVKNRICGGLDCDFNYVNSALPDVGEWAVTP